MDGHDAELTIPAVVRLAAQQYGGVEAVVDPSVRLTYAELAEAVTHCARAAVAYGVRPGDRVAVWAPNGHRWVVAALGMLSAGAVLVPVNTRFKGAEAHHVLAKARVRALVVDDGFLGNSYVEMLRDSFSDRPDRPERSDTAGDPDGSGGSGDALRGVAECPVATLPDLAHIVTLGAVTDASVVGWEEFLAAAERVSVEEVDRRIAALTADDPADIIFTSGTTGRPKGAVSTHRQNLRMYQTWSEVAGLRAGDRYLLVNPLFHSFGYKAGLLTCLLSGATVIPQATLDVEQTLGLIERERVTVLPGPPTLYVSILDHPARERFDLRTARLAVTGAAVVPVALVERMRRELSFETVLTAYGLTECCGTATMCRRGDDDETIATTSGRAVDGVELRIVDTAGNALPAGQSGEVVIGGYNVMTGYFEDDEATAAVLDGDGWLHTGDVGSLDPAGNLRITDRIKDMYVVGGFNTYPAEIEQTLARHEKVSDAAVVGVPDERLGEVGRAFVVARPGSTPTEAELVTYCRERLANYKVPRSVVLVDALPRNASGKVLKYVLRDR